MKSKSNGFTKLYTGTIAIISSLIVSGYWIFGNLFNVYTYKAVGAIYELLWIFMILLLFGIPVASLMGIIVSKFKNSYFYIIAIILNIGTFVWLNFYN